MMDRMGMGAAATTGVLRRGSFRGADHCYNHRMADRGSGPVCNNCGAPYSAGLVACSYCKSAYTGVSGGINCPRCGNANRRENPECVSCHAPLVRPCIFCGTASSLAASACQRCGEAFAGAEERKRARDAQVQQQQTVHLVEEGFGVVSKIASNPGVSSGILGVFETLIDEASKVSR
jgi:hypothetical protein